MKICDNNCIHTHNHLVCKRTLNYLARPANWLSCAVSAYLICYLFFLVLQQLLYKLFDKSSILTRRVKTKKLACFSNFYRRNCKMWPGDHFFSKKSWVALVDTGHKLNVHMRFRRRPGRFLNVLCLFSLRPVSTGADKPQNQLNFLNTNN